MRGSEFVFWQKADGVRTEVCRPLLISFTVVGVHQAMPTLGIIGKVGAAVWIGGAEVEPNLHTVRQTPRNTCSRTFYLRFSDVYH